MEIQKTPGMRIRALREMKFQSIRNLAEQAGISPSTLGRIETGAMKSIGSETLAKLAVALDVSADYILGLTPVQKRRNMDIVATGLSEERRAQADSPHRGCGHCEPPHGAQKLPAADQVHPHVFFQYRRNTACRPETASSTWRRMSCGT